MYFQCMETTDATSTYYSSHTVDYTYDFMPDPYMIH